jgi:hypothetical protein
MLWLPRARKRRHGPHRTAALSEEHAAVLDAERVSPGVAGVSDEDAARLRLGLTVLDREVVRRWESVDGWRKSWVRSRDARLEPVGTVASGPLHEPGGERGEVPAEEIGEGREFRREGERRSVISQGEQMASEPTLAQRTGRTRQLAPPSPVLEQLRTTPAASATYLAIPAQSGMVEATASSRGKQRRASDRSGGAENASGGPEAGELRSATRST